MHEECDQFHRAQRLSTHAPAVDMSVWYDFEDFLEKVRDLKIKRHHKSIDDFVYGAIVGSAVIHEVVRGSKSPWAFRGNFHWVLTQPKKSLPTRMKGQLGFFKVRGTR